VTIAEINLTLIWDVISQIDIGPHGQAYVIDAQGRLIAHRDISLVLRNTDFSQLAQVKSTRDRSNASTVQAVDGEDIHGRAVLASYAPVAPLDWLLFVELPKDDAYAPIYRSILLSILLLMAGIVWAAMAGLLLARRMIDPIRKLRIGAMRIGGGDLGHRIGIETRDELESVGDHFNSMAAQLQESYASLEHRVAERTRDLEFANAAKSRFLAVASHDLRQPLHALRLFVAQLRSPLKPRERTKTIERVDSAVGEMAEMFDSLLDISKLDAGILAPTISDFPIARLLQKVEATFEQTAREKGLRLRVVQTGAWVRSDAMLLERILFNLVSNAVRYTSRGGIIVGCRRRGGMMRIEVCDSGPGIPEDQRQNIFGEFVQLPTQHRERYGGLGLGLAIVDRLRQLLGHEIELISIVGRGSRFAIMASVVEESATSVETTDLPPPAAFAAHGGIVLVIDDSPMVQEGMAGLLDTWGYSVLTAGSAEDAFIQLAKRQRPDLIISDYHLQNGETGIDTIERMNAELNASIPSILISGDTSPERLRDAQDRGYILLHKPVDPMRLRAVMLKLIREHVDRKDADKASETIAS
jgi:signal transduction histidine kinase/CheY-like chemotaxis protein